MSLKIRRYQAEESDFTKAVTTRTHIEVPASVGFTDLTTSKLILDMEPEVSGAGATAVVPCTFGLNGEMVGGAQVLIRNSIVESKENGFMNEQRERNVVSANLDDWYLDSRATTDAKSLFGHGNNKNYGKSQASDLPDNPWIDFRRPTANGVAVTDSAVTRRAEIPVAWKHIDEFGSVSQFPNVAVGNMLYKLQFEDRMDVMSPVKMNTFQVYPCDNITLTGGASQFGDAGYPIVITCPANNIWHKPKVGHIITVSYRTSDGPALNDWTASSTVITAVNTVGGKYSIEVDILFSAGVNASITDLAAVVTDTSSFPTVLNNVTPAANRIGVSDATKLVLSNVFTNATPASYDRCPLYVGAAIRILFQDATSIAAGTVDAVVSSLTINGKDLEILVKDTAGNDGVDVGTSNALTQVGFGFRYETGNVKFAVNWRIHEVYAQLHEIQLLPSQREAARKALADLEIPFTSRYLKMRNMPSTAAHTEVIQADPNCAGVAVLTPQNLTLLSGFDNCSSYRFAIDGKETTNRDVRVGDERSVGRQLHNHLLKRFYGNLGKRLRKYDANPIDYAAPENQATHAFYPLVTPVVPRPQIIQLQLFSDTAMSGKPVFYVFYHQKVLALSNGRARVI